MLTSALPLDVPAAGLSADAMFMSFANLLSLCSGSPKAELDLPAVMSIAGLLSLASTSATAEAALPDAADDLTLAADDLSTAADDLPVAVDDLPAVDTEPTRCLGVSWRAES